MPQIPFYLAVTDLKARAFSELYALKSALTAPLQDDPGVLPFWHGRHQVYPEIQAKMQPDGRLAFLFLGENTVAASGGDLEKIIYKECRFDDRGENRYVSLCGGGNGKFDLFALGDNPWPRYALRRWTPFNGPDHTDFLRMGAANRFARLEYVLKNHLVTMAKALGFGEQAAESPIRCLIEPDSVRQETAAFKPGVSVAAFDLCFRSNLLLPEQIGIGKKTSYGFGTVMPAPARFGFTDTLSAKPR